MHRKNIVVAVGFCLLVILSNMALAGDVKLITKDAVKQSKDLQVQILLLGNILSNTPELNIHRMNGANDNQVIVNDKGQEYVFDKNKEHVRDCTNRASPNYFNPKNIPFKHFMVDAVPWVSMGNCPDDKTTREQRIQAYMKDYKIGVDLTFSGGRLHFPAGFKFNDKLTSQIVYGLIDGFEKRGFSMSDFVAKGGHKDKKMQEEWIKIFESILMDEDYKTFLSAD